MPLIINIYAAIDLDKIIFFETLPRAKIKERKKPIGKAKIRRRIVSSIALKTSKKLEKINEFNM